MTILGADTYPTMRRSMERIDRKSSIETEPRTLKLDQIQNAREAALSVINTRSLEEAMHIFTEGLEPVTHSVGGGKCMEMGWGVEERSLGIGMGNEFRDVASAPF